MRKREQELLAKIKEQQKELDTVKAEKTKVEKELTRAEREREEDRRLMFEKEREIERQRIEAERQNERQKSVEPDPYRNKPFERVLNREKASPAHLRGRRPPSLVSSENDEEVKQISLLSQQRQLLMGRESISPSNVVPIPIAIIKSDDTAFKQTPTHTDKHGDTMSQQHSPTPPRSAQAPNKNSDLLQRRPSLRRNRPEGSSSNMASSLNRSQSFRIKRDSVNGSQGEVREVKPRIAPSPRTMRKEFSPSTARDSKEKPTSVKLQRTPSLRRKSEANTTKAKEENKNSSPASRPIGLSRLRGPSREASFDEDKSPVSRSSVKNRSTTSTYINGHSANAGNNTVKIDIKDAKKSVPPSPAPKKKTPSTPARRSLFAPKPRDDLVSCKNCGRNFAEDRIEKHQEICLKTAQKAKKRKVFDMTKARVKGTDAAKYVKSAAHLKNTEAKEQKKSDWRKKREDFINTLRAAKEAQKHLANGGSIKDLPPPPPMDTSDYIQCPHCNRRFAEAAAERHIPKCKDIKSNKRR